MIRYEHDDGGRKAAGFRGETGDCVCRAVAIASGRDYLTVYDEINALAKAVRTTKSKRSHARTGVHTNRKWFRQYMDRLGFRWTPTMAIGSGCTVHVRAEDLPMTGRHVLALSKHASALVDGVLRDTADPSRGGSRCVYGYWSL